MISGELMAYSLSIPPEYKIRIESGGKVEKWILRKAFEEEGPVASFFISHPLARCHGTWHL